MSSRQNDMASTQLTTPEPDTHALATYLEKTDSVRTKVRAALSYPVFVLVFSIAAACLLLLKIVPTFGQIYADMGQKLPALTQGVLDASSFLRSNILVGAALIGLPAGSFVVFSRTRRGKRLLDGMLLRVPIFGPIVRKSVMSRVCRTLGLLSTAASPSSMP